MNDSHAVPAATRGAIFEFVLLDAFSMLSVTSAIEPLRVANRMAGRNHYAWRIVSEDGKPVRASNGLVLESEGRLWDGGRPDYCFVCAGMSLIAAHPTQLSAFLSRRASAGVTMGAISMGTIFLARAGLLRDRRCTIHWEGQPAFTEEFPEIKLSRAIYEIDESQGRGVMTCAGGMSSFDLMMALIARDHGPHLVRMIANQLQLDRIRSNLCQQSPGSDQVLDTAPKQLRNAITLIARDIEQPISPNDLADAVGSSRRTLERLFLKYIGTTPSRYCKTRRLERAHDLLTHSSMPILDVAMATGFRSASYFSSSFSEHYGISPSMLRQGLIHGRPPRQP